MVAATTFYYFIKYNILFFSINVSMSMSSDSSWLRGNISKNNTPAAAFFDLFANMNWMILINKQKIHTVSTIDVDNLTTAIVNWIKKK